MARPRQQAAHKIGKHGGRNAHRKGGNQRPREARDGVADQGYDQHIRSRRHLRYREHIGELLVGHPVLNVDRNPVHLRNRGIGAAHRKQRHQPEGPGQRPDRVALRIHAAALRRVTKVMAMLSGIATSNTAGNGSRASPIAVNTAASTTRPTRSRLLISGIIIRKTADISRPTAAQDTPARMRRRASISPKCAYSAAKIVTMRVGGPSSPAKAAMPPAMPRKRDPNTTDRLTTLGPGRKW